MAISKVLTFSAAFAAALAEQDAAPTALAAQADAPLAGQGAKFGFLLVIGIIGALAGGGAQRLNEVLYPQKTETGKSEPFLAAEKGSGKLASMEAGKIVPAPQKTNQNVKPALPPVAAKKTENGQNGNAKPKDATPRSNSRPTTPRVTQPAGPNIVQHLVSAALGRTTAYCRMTPTHSSNAESLAGRIDFEQVDEKTCKIKYQFQGLAPGLHGLHIFSEKESNKASHTSEEVHRALAAKGRSHVGDLGNIKADANGVARGEIVDSFLKLNGPSSAFGFTAKVFTEPNDLAWRGTALGDLAASGRCALQQGAERMGMNKHTLQALASRGSCLASGEIKRT